MEKINSDLTIIDNNLQTIKPKRRESRKVIVGGIPVGGGSPVSVQTMTKTKTSDVEATVKQINKCAEAGADIVRVTVNDKQAADAIGEIVKSVDVPIVADIHFNHIFALKSIDAGVSKVRINPGNIGAEKRIKQVLDKAGENNIPIRIGVNSGSLEKDLLEKYMFPTAEALYESAMRHVEISTGHGFENLVISVKSTRVDLMIDAYRLIALKTDFPLHLGVTEAGTMRVGTIKSAVGIGSLLAEGIGDTIRVSLTDEPQKEVEVGKEILRSLGLAQRGVELISCPTCGRIEVDLMTIMKNLEEALKNIKKTVRVSILGCAVNGPGEAKDSDIGLACKKGGAVLYKKGVRIKNIPEDKIVEEVYKEVLKFQPEE